MKYSFLLICCLCAVVPYAAGASFFEDDNSAAVAAGAGISFEPVFSSSGVPSDTIVKAIESAKKSIRISAHSFVSKPVSEAIIKMSRAGVDVKMVLDNKTNQGIDSAARFLMAMDYMPHVTKGDSGIYQNYIVIDDHDIVLGSIAALPDSVEEKKNATSALVIHNTPELAQKYLTNWQTLWDASVEMTKPKD